MCDCLQLTYHVIEDPNEPTTIQLGISGTLNGYNYYEFTIGDTTFYIWHNGVEDWYVSTTLGSLPAVTGIKVNEDPCPIAEMPVWTPGSTFDVFTTSDCTDEGCKCLKISIQENRSEPIYSITVNSGISYNGKNTYSWSIGANNYSLFFDGTKWLITNDGIGGTGILAILNTPLNCPTSGDIFWELTPFIFSLETKSCGCVKREDRYAEFFGSVKLPSTFEEQNRGLKDCCCKQMVLASEEGESWKNDITSAWIKLSSGLDNFTFELLKEGQSTNYVPQPVQFVNDLAYYTTIEWKDVLASDGIGCYTLIINYQISGISGQLVWGEYQLKRYSIQTALKTARVKAIFNGYHEVEGIDFTASNVVSTHRFFGFIGERQPNMAIDNLIYNNREVKRNIRENLFDYNITTDPEDECIIAPLVELYLLSENELFISDYNAHNHSYRYLDLPVIVAESPAIEYKDFSRKAVLTCKVGDKFKNKRTFYNG